ncbi:BEACH domain-containing protein C2-like [Arachis duranensis]|uniref:BEACH domain-containing protein C2-like n=1 Tax=Arachis duranensis TaxID=130453 RepID=A0A9C6WR01_ARADU|nr:BEACH domain-containing protein C2-like [Arachis duranensis]
MEEEDESKEIKTSGIELDSGGVVDGSVMQSGKSNQKENLSVGSGVEDEHEVEKQGRGVDFATSLVDESQFEQVYLKDQEKNNEYAYSKQPSGLDDVQQPVDGNAEDLQYPSGTYSTGYSSPVADMQHYPFSPEAEEHFGQSASSTGLNTPGFSPVRSPSKPRQKNAVPNVSAELLHLVDSAIMGKPESMEKLKNIASGVEILGNGEEMENVAFLIVDSLLATMGGVESFDEDGANNPPSVMLNSRAAIVSGELIPWLPYVGDSDAVMSPRTRMVRGLLAILRACTRNRAMCSMAVFVIFIDGSKSSQEPLPRYGLHA